MNDLKGTIKSFSLKISERWEKCSRKLELFEQKYEDWLNGDDIQFQISTCSDVQPSTSGTGRGGRPKKIFEESSEKSKKRKVQHVLESTSYGELTFAAEVAVRSAGKRDAANIIKELSTASPERASEIKHLRSTKGDMRVYNPEEALALFVDCKLTTNSYKLMRKRAIGAGHFLYPSYYSIQKAKAECCPSEEFLTITETSAEISLQAIIDLTVTRLVIAQETVFKHLLSANITDFKLISKWGCDGSSGHSRYKQKFSNPNCDDEYLFLFTFVPIKIHPIGDENIYTWQNPRTSSTRICRPIKFMFSKETSELTRSETKLIQNQIDNLKPTKVNVEGTEITVYSQMLLTMVDGKVCNSLTETASSQTCYICGATPKTMNLDSTKQLPEPENYGFGISTLHAWIRTFECLLHISYRLNIKKWQVKTAEEKADMKQRKLDIQNGFKEEMGLIVDRPKPGFGSTNDGNTARRFFKNSQKSAEITGLDENLIKRFSVILQVLSSGYDINTDEFKKYAAETKVLYLTLYPWYYMPVTVHKILVHSADIIECTQLPIGQLSEEAQEARNKDCRRFREFHTQKKSRTSTNKDLLRMLLITSDPIVNSYREVPRKSSGSIPIEVIKLLRCPATPTQPQRVSSDSPDEYDKNDYFVEDTEEDTQSESGSDSDSD